MLNDSMWRLEQFQTRARIQASQSRFWLRNALLVWFVGTVMALMFGLSLPDRQKNAAAWVVASTVGAVLPQKTVAWNGARYKAGELARWMDAELYQGTLMQWLWWAAGWGVLPVALFCSGGLVWMRRRQDSERHIRGAEVVKVEELQRRLRKAGKGTITLAGIPLPTEIERRHTSICGATGSGKSVTLFDLLTQFDAQDIPCIVVGGAGEIAARFYNEERGDILFNPLDARCPTWTPWLEGDSEEAIAAHAASWFPILPGQIGPAAYYAQQAQIRYRDLISHARVRDVWQIPQMLKEEIEKKGSRFGKPEVISTLQNALESLRYLRPGRREWSAREWVAKPKGWVFLSFRKREEAAVRPLISFLLECLSRELLSGEESPVIRVRIVIEEVAALGPQLTLFRIVNEGRKYGAPVTAAFQDVKQLVPLYGQDFTDNMLAQFGSHLMLRTGGEATQQWCAANIGNREVVRPVESETVGPSNVRDSISRSHQRREEAAVLASDFGMLPDGVGYLKVSPYGVAKVRVPYAPIVARVPAFVAREEGGDPIRNGTGSGVKGEGGREKVVVKRERRRV